MTNFEDLKSPYTITAVRPIEKSDEIKEYERRSKPLTIGAMEDIMQVSVAQLLQGIREIVKEQNQKPAREPSTSDTESVFDEINRKFGGA